MKKSLLVMFLVLLFLICLVSCPNPSEKVQINFYAYDQNNGGRYQLYKTESVAKGSSFNENIGPTIGTVLKQGDDTTVYRYNYWTNSQPGVLNSPCTDNLARFNNGTQIDRDINLYVVYKEEVASKFSITYMTWKDGSYKELSKMENVVEGTLLKNIHHPEDDVADVTIEGKNYSFVKNRWAKSVSEEDAILDISATSGAYDGSDDITNNDVLVDNITLYAVYGQKVKVEFHTWKNETGYSILLPGYSFDVFKNDKIDLNGSYKNIAKESVNKGDSTLYHFAFWTNNLPPDNDFFKNVSNDVYTDINKFDLENKSITADTTKLYAVYGEQNHIYYYGFNENDSKLDTSTSLDCSDFVTNGTKFNDLPAEKKPTSDHIPAELIYPDSGDNQITYYFSGKYSTQKPVNPTDPTIDATVADSVNLEEFDKNAPIKEDLVLYPIYTKTPIKVTYYTYNQETRGYTIAKDKAIPKDEIIDINQGDCPFYLKTRDVNTPVVENADGTQTKYVCTGWLKTTEPSITQSIITSGTPFDFDTPISQSTVLVAIYKKLSSHNLSFYKWVGDANTGEYKEIDGSQKIVFDGDKFATSKPESDPDNISDQIEFKYWTIEKKRGSSGYILTSEAGNFAPLDIGETAIRVFDEPDSPNLKFYAVYGSET